MAVAYADIARVLSGARRRQFRVVLATALALGLAGTLLALLGGAAALALGADGVARAASLALAVLSLVAAAGWAGRALWRQARRPEAVARAVAAADPSLRSALVTSVELEREYPDVAASGRFSIALVDAHIERTAERARAIDLARAVPSRAARRAGLALGAIVLAQALSLVAFRPALGRAYARLLGGETVPAAAHRAEPITGDVEVAYVYPAYMRRPEKKLSGTGGEVTAPKGTEVRLRTRSDRPVSEAELLIAPASAPPQPESRSDGGEGGGEGPRSFALAVAGGRDLAGGFTVDSPGTYRFRFLARGKVVAEGPPIPISVEPDAFPEVRITAPGAEVEVDAGAQVRVDWTASDDWGLEDLSLVVKPPMAEERRRSLATFAGAHRDAGTFTLDLGPEKLAEGERLLYWLEVRDNDAISGPKRSASATQAVKVFSEAEHHRAVLEKARGLWEEMVRLLGDRLEQLAAAGRPALERAAVGEALDVRARHLHERMREAAAEIRLDRAAPKEIPVALANVAGALRLAEGRLVAARQTWSRLVRMGRDDPGLGRRVADLDDEMNRELEKDILYLEALFDKRKAEDLVRMAKDLAARRRDLASLVEKYRAAPTQEGKKELLAEIARMKQRMKDLLRQMGELAKGIDDEHMNAEALAEMARSKDMAGGLDRVEELLAKGDLDGALKELDALGGTLQEMLSSLQRTAGLPDEKAAALMKDMLSFKRDLEAVQAEQERLAAETEQLKAGYKKKIAERLRGAEERARRLEELARKAAGEVKEAGKGVSLRSEDDLAQARDRLADLEKALAMRDFDAALDVARRALPAMGRLAAGLEDDAIVAERYQVVSRKDPAQIREAQRHAQAAIPPAREVKDELEQLFPDPRSVLGKGEQAKLDRMSKRQSELEQQAGALHRKLRDLAQRAPVFPPSAGQGIADSRSHMLQAADELARKNAQRGHGQQRQALDALERLRKGLEEMAKRGGGRGGGGFPFPFAEAGTGEGDGSVGDPSREPVEIPGADAYKVPEEFRKDLLEAMKQGVPEPYQGEVKRYYEELVK